MDPIVHIHFIRYLGGILSLAQDKAPAVYGTSYSIG